MNLLGTHYVQGWKKFPLKTGRIYFCSRSVPALGNQKDLGFVYTSARFLAFKVNPLERELCYTPSPYCLSFNKHLNLNLSAWLWEC
jgi:hypothetical protein